MAMAASAGTDANGEVEAAGTISKKNSRRRIADYLGDSDSPPPPETPPQLRLPRFTCAKFLFVRFGRKRDGRKDVAAKQKTEDSPAAGSKPSETSTSSSSASAEAGGVGLSMLLLLARTCVELNRMAEVRAQMETLLKEIRGEASSRTMMKASAQHHHVVVTPRTVNLQLSSSTTTAVSSSGCTPPDTDANHRRHATATKEIARRECESGPAEDEERTTGVVQLEATEFEAEPVQHQHCPTLQCDDSEQDESSSDDEFIELDGGRFGGGVNGDFKWDDAGDGDSEAESSATRAQDDGGGVCAIELERRLHELLHRRNRDRIAELESALRRAEQKLREKEMEARLWQDTATLALQPPPPPPPLDGEGEHLAVEAGMKMV